MVSFEVSLQPAPGKRSMFEEGVTPTLDSLDDRRMDRDRAIEVARRLQAHGVDVKGIGDFTISASTDDTTFEAFFGVRLEPVQLDPLVAEAGYEAKAPRVRVSPPAVDGLDQLVERVYVQHDPILFAGERAIPPLGLVNPKFRLRVPGDIAQVMGAAAVHRRGVTGSGVRVAMVDTGFYPHPYFRDQGVDFLAVAAPDVTEPENDASGHGTGESANVFATAPGINFVGVKMNNPTLAFRTAVELRPDVITCSWGYHVDAPNTTMPSWLTPLYLEVLNAVAQGVIVCFSAGNGHLAFPACIPEVIAVGGTVVDANLALRATQYTSGFMSTWFPGRRVPDITGLCGEPPTADYIVLPVQKGSSLDQFNGWGAFSGTSAASPMVAGVCALLREVDPDLTPQNAKNVLQYTATDIVSGQCAQGHAAGPGPDLATGYGLVNAARAVEVLL